MASSSHPLRYAHLALLLSIFLQLASISFMKPLCHSDERSALLQFKQSFRIDASASKDPSSYPKVESWNDTDCCLWDGVDCDELTGHAIGLDLSSSCLSLYGSFNSNSSLFYLSHLQSLNLGDNNFNFSQIPTKIASLSNLIYLNLSFSTFSGQIPMEILELRNLTCLDLHGNYDYEHDAFYLYLVDFRRFVQNLTKLETLDLSRVDISSSLPDIFTDIPFLASLILKGCNLTGVMPSSLGELTKLASLDLSDNNFSGQAPSSLGECTKLASLDLSSNELSGEVPSWLENLTELVELDLSDNSFTEGGFSWLGKQTKLKSLRLGNVNLVGDIPPCLKNLTQLQHLSLIKNNLENQIPSWLSNLTQLTELALGHNELHGPISESISQLVSLEYLDLGPNHLSGVVRFDMFSGMKHLNSLQLSGNSNVTLLIDESINATLSKFEMLGLSDCNLTKFPDFIRYQNHLSFLALKGNNIEGRIPNWIENVGKENIFVLDLSQNSFSGLEWPLIFSLLKSLVFLDLSDNKLQGPLPPPPLSVQHYRVTNNNLRGEISPWFCNLKSLVLFDLSNNNLRGKIPKCLGNSSDSLAILNLAGNRFNGNIPDTFGNGSKLTTISLRRNQLEGSLPRSLANCKMLQFLDLSENQIYDKFPTWLGSLPKLEGLSLRSNYLFGVLETPDELFPFPKLRILDLSNNEFTGTIPSGFFQTFNNMKAFDWHQEACLQEQLNFEQGIGTIPSVFFQTFNNMEAFDWHQEACMYGSPIYLTIKGFFLEFGKLQHLLAAIDFSSNKFQGDIPESIANLKTIHALGFSKNQLSGHIPSFLGNLTNLESLDLSNNKFSGEIPTQLMELDFLGYFDVSNNQLTGSIPQGTQLFSFDKTRYEGNSGLCGRPLNNECGNLVASSQPHDEGSKLPVDVSWKSLAVGYWSGIVVGVVLGLVFYERHQNRVLDTFGGWQKRGPRTRGRRTIR